MVGLAVALTDAGLGDYWDDVEQYARNGLIEAQATDRDEMVRVSEAGRARPKDSPWGGRYDWPLRQQQQGRAQRPGDHRAGRSTASLGAFGHLLQGRFLTPMLMTLLHGQRRPGPVLRLGGHCPRPQRLGGSEPVAQPPLALVRRLELAPLLGQAGRAEQGNAAAGRSANPAGLGRQRSAAGSTAAKCSRPGWATACCWTA